jgi:hypothetical protein
VRIKEQPPIKIYVSKRWSYFLQLLLTTRHSIMNTIGKTYAINEGINNHAHPITITTPRVVGIPI